MVSRNLSSVLILLLVFLAGFANLATEIIGPRMFASLFGNTSAVWAVMISVTLVGLSVGYALGGRVAFESISKVLPVTLLVNAMWLLAVGWLVWEIPLSMVASGVRIDFTVLLLTSTAAFFVPSALFGMITPMAITLLAREDNAERFSEIVGNVYALGTIGSVLGALSAAYFFIPYIGLSASLRLFALILVGFAVYFTVPQRRLLVSGVLLIGIALPQPDYQWRNDDDLELLAQRDGYYQTIRVYADGENFVQMHLGPTFHSKMNLDTGEPAFNYAQRMMELARQDVTGKRVLVIGGAGHAMARALENDGAIVTEVEIDPLVVALSDEYFGEIESEVILQDGRVYVGLAEDNTYDLILVDAFDGAATVPPQLTTIEFFTDIRRILKPDGRMIYNFVGTPEGERSRSYHALSATIRAVFAEVGVTSSTSVAVEGENSQNIIFIAADAALNDLEIVTPPTDGQVLTDELNPIDIFTQESRGWYYFRG